MATQTMLPSVPPRGMPPRRRFMADGQPPSLYAPPTYNSTTNPIAYNPIDINNGNAPVQVGAAQRQWTAGQGGALLANDSALADQYGQQAYGTQSYLNPIEQNLASGGGGYSPQEAQQINLTPEQQQNIVTGAGISAGAGTASSVGAAERSAAAAGGNPSATAAYRARAAQTEGAQAGDAMTQARIGAQQAGSAGAQAVGNARMNQQAQGTQYLGNLQAQQSTAAQNEQGLAQGAYGTEASATGAATGQEINAAVLPTIADKIIGAGAGAISGVAEGRKGVSDYFDDGMDAVVGEAGPEAIIEHPDHMAEGGWAPDNQAVLKGIGGALSGYLGNVYENSSQQQQKPDDFSNLAAMARNKINPYFQAGKAVSSLAHKLAMRRTAPTDPYNNQGQDSTGTYTAPGGQPTPITSGPGDDEMGSASYFADGLDFADAGSDDSNDSNGKNPDGSPKAPVQKIADPQQNVRNYLQTAMANALKPQAPDQTYGLAWGGPKQTILQAPTGGTPARGTPKQPVTPNLPATTGIDPPKGGGTPGRNLPVTTSFPPPPPPRGTPQPQPAQPLPPNVNQPSRGDLPMGTDTTVTYPPGENGSPMQIVPTGSLTTGGPAPPPTRTIAIPEPPDVNAAGEGTGRLMGPDESIPDNTGIPPPDLSQIQPPDNSGSGPTTPELPQGPPTPPDFYPTYAGDEDPETTFGTSSTIDYSPGVDPSYFQTDDSGVPDWSWEADGRTGNAEHMAGGGMRSPFHWSERQPHQMRAPAGGYTPMNFRAKPMMADGMRMGPADPPAQPQTPQPRYQLASTMRQVTRDESWPKMGPPTVNQSSRIIHGRDFENSPGRGGHPTPEADLPPAPHMANGAKIVTSPTRVKLAPGDQVVPLSFRPKAKIRPSAALPALRAAPPVIQPSFRARPGVAA